MPTAAVTRSDSNRSDASQRPRVSFNRDVHVKRIVPRENPRVSGAISGIKGEVVVTSPIRKERSKKSKNDLATEAAKVLRQADNVDCIVDDRGKIPDRFYTLPSRKKNKEIQRNYPSQSLDRRNNKRRGSLELVPPKKPPRTFSTISSSPVSSSKPSIFNIFKKSEKKTGTKKSNLRRSVSDASALRSKAYGPANNGLKIGIRSESHSEENLKKLNVKKQLSPIIEISQREDYFTPIDNSTDKENINANIQAPARKKNKISESVTDQLKDYIDEVDEKLYKETGIRIQTPNLKKDPEPIIIDVDKAEKISTNKKSKLTNFGLGKKLKSLGHKQKKSNDAVKKTQTLQHFTGTTRLISTENSIDSDIKVQKPKLEEKLSSDSITPIIQTTIQDLENSVSKSPTMMHSSQKPVEKPALTKGRTVNTMVKRLVHDSYSSPPPTRTNVLIAPNVSIQHNNNQPFSYTRGLSPEKYVSNEDLPNPTKPIIYAQVVCGGNGLRTGKQTVHTAFNTNGRRQPQSDSDEGLGGEENSGLVRKYGQGKTYTLFGDDRYESYRKSTDQYIDEIDNYKAESPILPKYKHPSHLNGFPTYDEGLDSKFIDSSARGRGDGMDAKRRESLTEHDNDFETNVAGRSFLNSRTDLSTRRDILESRINRRFTDKNTGVSPEHSSNRNPTNVYITETSSKYYRSGSTSPKGYKEKYVSETKTDKYGERHTSESRTNKYFSDPNKRLPAHGYSNNGFDSEPKSLDSQVSDYRSSPETRRFESSHNTNSRSRYRKEKQVLSKDRDIHKSTPEIHHTDYLNDRSYLDSYHDSLPRPEKIQSRTTGGSQKYRSERYLNHTDSDRRGERFVDSGIENDFRRESVENYRLSTPTKAPREYYNESEDEGFASSLLIASEKQHTEDNLTHKSRNDYDSDRTHSREDDSYRRGHSIEYNNKYTPRERSIDDGSHYDPRIDKDIDRSTLKRVENKPPKPEKKSGLEKVKSLFMRENKKKKENMKNDTLREKYNGYNKRDSSATNKITENSDYKNRRRLSTPSPSPTREIHRNAKPESTHGSWFKSLDRLSRRKTKKDDGNFTSTEDEVTTGPSKSLPSSKNLRFFGDTDQESNGDSVRGRKSVFKSRPGLRSQSTRDLHNISEELHKSPSSRRKPETLHKSMTNISETDREVRGNRTTLKPPMSPNLRYSKETPRHIDERSRRRRHEISSVESSTEGDSSQQSQRSIVYLHAATVGDIPGPDYLQNGRRAASREDLTSNGSSLIQPQVKTLSRSFSVLAPWKPRHYREAMDIDYTQYTKSSKNGKFEQKTSKTTSSRNESSTLKKKAQDSRKNNRQMTLSRKSKSKENLTPSQTLRRSKEELSRGSTSTLYKKKNKLPRENLRYIKDKEDKKVPTKSFSVESINRRSKEEGRDVSRSVSMPRDTGKSAGWFKKSKK